MSTLTIPPAKPLIGPDGKVIFLVSHIDYIIDGLSASNPNLQGPLKIKDKEIFGIKADGSINPLQPLYGGTGQTSFADLATEIAKQLGFVQSGSGGAVGVIPIAKGGTGATTAAAALTALGAASVKRYTCSVSTGWSTNSAGGYMKSVTVTGITANDCPVVGIVLSNDVAASKTQAQAFGNVSRIVTAANSITLYAFNTAPTTAFSLQLLCVRGF